MAKAAVKTEVAIELPQLKIGHMEVTVIGDTPLIVHKWSTKAKKEMLAKMTKAPKAAREAKDPRREFEDSLYRFPDGRYGFPSIAFKVAAVTACTSTGGITKVAARQAFAILGEGVDLDGAFDGVKMRADLVAIEGSEPRIREDAVTVGMGSADLRYRGEFWPWHAKLIVRFNANVLSEAQILNLINTAGFACGVGEWRPQRDGQSGTFHVATEADLRSIASPKGKRR